MGYDICVLRAIVRLSRRQNPATNEALLARVPGRAGDLRASLRRLERSGLVTLSGSAASLTLGGLAVAVASLPPVAITARARPAASRPRDRARVFAA